MTFHVGQKVVCVDAKRIWNAMPLTKGQVYTVRDRGREKHRPEDWVLLEEVVSNCDAIVGEFAYRASRFRPVVERKTSIEIFTAMLNPSKAGVDA